MTTSSATATPSSSRYPRTLQHDDLGLLQTTLQEEKEADRLLTSLAEGGINAAAEHTGAEDTEAGDAGEKPCGNRRCERPATAGRRMARGAVRH